MDDECFAPACSCQRFAFTPIEDTGSHQDPEPFSKWRGDEFYAYRQQAVAGESVLIKLANDLAAERDALLATVKSRDQWIEYLEEEGFAVVRLLRDIDAAGGFVTELATELSDRIDAVLEGTEVGAL